VKKAKKTIKGKGKKAAVKTVAAGSPKLSPKASPKASPRASPSSISDAKAKPVGPSESLMSADSTDAPQVPAPAEAAVKYDGKPLDLQTAETLFTGLSPSELAALATSSSAEEQLPARMLMEFVGDKDVSWANAKKSLQDGAALKKEVLEMSGASYVTKGSLERFDALGKLEPKALQYKSPAAFAISVYLEAIMWVAKEKFGMNEQVILPPAEEEQPSEWPIMIGIKELPAALTEALRWKRTPLFLCQGKVHVVDQFFSYQSCALVDAKWILNKVDIKKEMDVSQMREQIRARLVSALKFGQPIHISMSNSAVTLKTKYCTDTEFPEGLFKQDVWFEKSTYSKVIREEDLDNWPGAFRGRMKDDSASYAFVTSDFGLDSAKEFLPNVLPYFNDMAIIQVDPSTIDA